MSEPKIWHSILYIDEERAHIEGVCQNCATPYERDAPLEPPEYEDGEYEPMMPELCIDCLRLLEYI